MQIALIISGLIITVFVCLSDFSNLNLDDDTERLLYVLNDDTGNRVDNNSQPDLSNDLDESYDNSSDSDTNINDFNFDFTETGDIDLKESAEDLIAQIYNDN